MRQGAENETPIEGEIIHESGQGPDTTMAMVVYALYLASFVVGFTALIGVVIAYVYRGKGPHWLDEHFRYQIRTFWIGLLFVTLFSLLTFVLIGFPLLVALAVWLIVRCVKGFKGLQEKRAPSNVDTWLL